MAINYIAAEFKPLYTPFDYSTLPCKEYIPPISLSPIQAITAEIKSALRLNTCTPAMVQKLTTLLDQDLPFESLKAIEDAKNLLDDLQDRASELTNTRHYREVVFMQESDADEALSILDAEGVEAAIQYLADYDQGEGDVYKTPPWGTHDDTFKSGIYTLAVNFNIPYISLYAE